MRLVDLMKGFLIKPVMEILKKDHNIKSPTPTCLFVQLLNNEWYVVYKHNKMDIDFTNDNTIKQIIQDIKNKPEYEKVWL